MRANITGLQKAHRPSQQTTRSSKRKFQPECFARRECWPCVACHRLVTAFVRTSSAPFCRGRFLPKATCPTDLTPVGLFHFGEREVGAIELSVLAGGGRV